MAEIETYSLVLVLHITAVISWMAGMLYLPRLFVYHTQVEYGSQSDRIFQVMERKLLRYIINPAMIVTFGAGIYLASEIGFSHGWLHVKLMLVLLLSAFHGFLAKCRKNFERGINKHSEKFFRICNEVPTVLMIAIIFLVITKPF